MAATCRHVTENQRSGSSMLDGAIACCCCCCSCGRGIIFTLSVSVDIAFALRMAAAAAAADVAALDLCIASRAVFIFDGAKGVVGGV